MDLHFPNGIGAILALLFAALIVLAIKGLLAYVVITVLKALSYISVSTVDAVQHIRDESGIRTQKAAGRSPAVTRSRTLTKDTDLAVRERYTRAVADRRDRERNLRIFGAIAAVFVISIVGFIILGIVAMHTSPAAP